MAQMTTGTVVKPAPRPEQTRSLDPPQWITNLLKYLLRSRLHFIFSKSLMLLAFRGRKTGRIYSTPVGYEREGDVVTAFTDSPWYRNLLDGAPVTMYLKGKAVAGFAEVVDDRAAVTEALMRHLRHARFDAKYYGVGYDANGVPIRADVEKGSRDHVMLKIRLFAPARTGAR